MIDPAKRTPIDLSKLTKEKFVHLIGDRGIELLPEHMKYWRYIDGVLWFIIVGSPDNDTPSGYADSWAVITEDNRISGGFEILDSVLIADSPLNDLVPKGLEINNCRSHTALRGKIV